MMKEIVMAQEIQNPILIIRMHEVIQSPRESLGKKVGYVVILFFFVVFILLRDALVAFFASMGKDIVKMIVSDTQVTDTIKEKLLTILNDPQVTDTLKEKLKAILNDPQVTDTLKEKLLAILNDAEVTATLKEKLFEIVSDPVLTEKLKETLISLIEDRGVRKTLLDLLTSTCNSQELFNTLVQRCNAILSDPLISYNTQTFLYNVLKSVGKVSTLIINIPAPNERVKSLLVNASIAQILTFVTYGPYKENTELVEYIKSAPFKEKLSDIYENKDITLNEHLLFGSLSDPSGLYNFIFNEITSKAGPYLTNFKYKNDSLSTPSTPSSGGGGAK
jgi:hypothetical protein